MISTNANLVFDKFRFSSILRYQILLTYFYDDLCEEVTCEIVNFDRKVPISVICINSFVTKKQDTNKLCRCHMFTPLSLKVSFVKQIQYRAFALLNSILCFFGSTDQNQFLQLRLRSTKGYLRSLVKILLEITEKVHVRYFPL